MGYWWITAETVAWFTWLYQDLPHIATPKFVGARFNDKTEWSLHHPKHDRSHLASGPLPTAQIKMVAIPKFRCCEIPKEISPVEESVEIPKSPPHPGCSHGQYISRDRTWASWRSSANLSDLIHLGPPVLGRNTHKEHRQIDKKGLGLNPGRSWFVGNLQV